MDAVALSVRSTSGSLICDGPSKRAAPKVMYGSGSFPGFREGIGLDGIQTTISKRKSCCIRLGFVGHNKNILCFFHGTLGELFRFFCFFSRLV